MVTKVGLIQLLKVEKCVNSISLFPSLADMEKISVENFLQAYSYQEENCDSPKILASKLTYFQSNVFESLRQICIVRYSESVMENF
jgi:hypothetical protein